MDLEIVAKNDKVWSPYLQSSKEEEEEEEAWL